jgi:methylenetetrahydrofolate dehydrogenase (NADP+)/methenyltetrahydrofolate cyclohydrolase
MQIFDGKAHALLLEERIQQYLKHNPQFTGPDAKKLGIIQIGDNPASTTYVNMKRKFCEKLTLPVEIRILEKDRSDTDLILEAQSFFEREDISGGLVQLPLPRSNLDPILGVIPVSKDIDLLSPESKRRFYAGEFDRLSPTIRAFDYFLEQTELDQEKISLGIIGYGELVGKPVAHFSTISGIKTEVIGWYENETKLDYQLLVLSAGVPNLVNPENLTEGTSIIDFGFSKIGDKTVGDLDMSKNLDHLGFISPSVGGVGPVVIRFLIMNFLGI